MINQRHTCSPALERFPQQLTRGDNTHAVRRCQVDAVEQPPKNRVAASLHHELRVDGAYLVQTSGPFAQERFDDLDRPCLIAVVYPDSKYPYPAQKQPLKNDPPVMKYKAVRSWRQMA